MTTESFFNLFLEELKTLPELSHYYKFLSSPNDLEFRKNSRNSALWLAKTQPGWIKIDCVVDGKMDTRENIHHKIYEKISKIIK